MSPLESIINVHVRLILREDSVKERKGGRDTLLFFLVPEFSAIPVQIIMS